MDAVSRRSAEDVVDGGYAWVMLALGTVLVALNLGALSSLSVFLKPLSAEFGWARGATALSYTTAAVTIGVAGVFWGRVADRYGTRPVVLLGAVAQPTALLLLTDVSAVQRGFGTPQAEPITTATPEQLLALGLPAGSMGPKVEAAAWFVQQTGGRAAIGSLADAALAAAGFRNMSADYRLTRGGQVPLESLVARPPDLLVLGSAPEEYRTALADNLRHPIIRLLRQRRASLELPWRHWLCGTPHIADAIERLAEARMLIEGRRK